jgi:hypothetical protein
MKRGPEIITVTLPPTVQPQPTTQIHGIMAQTPPMTATDIPWAVMAANDVKTDDKKAAQIPGQGIQASLRNHSGKGVQQVN